MISEKVIRVDVDLFDDTAQSQLNDAPIVSWFASPPRLPSVHPLAVISVFIWNKNAPAWLEKIFLICEELIVRQQRDPANALRG